MLAGSAPSIGGPASQPLARWVWAALFALVIGGMAWASVDAFWHCDDAYISFRYVWHALHGDGLVFNVGERVEGYTNLAWVLELALVQRLTSMPPEIACDVLGALCTAGCVACVVLLARAAPFEGKRALAALGALAILAVSRTWAVWTTSGLETRQFTLCVLVGALFLHRAVRDPDSDRFRRRLAIAALAFAMSELTRPEGALLGVCAAAWLLVEMRIARRFRWSSVAWFAAPLVLVIAAHYLWRRGYYGDWLPNTYYAKVVRAWPEAGWRYVVAALIETGAWLLVPFALVAAVARARRGDRLYVLAALLVLPHVAYLAMIGGDHFEWRPLDFDWPFLALAASEGLVLVAASLIARTKLTRASTRLVVERALAGSFLLIACAYTAAVQTAKLDFTLPLTTRAQTVSMELHLTRENSPWLYRLPGMALLMPLYTDAYGFVLKRGVGVPWREHERFWRDEMARFGPLCCLRDKGSLPDDMVCPRISIGVAGYCLASTTLIDRKGLTDRHVAHTPSLRSNAERYMAHDRSADKEYLEERHANVQLVGSARDAVSALAEASFALRAGEDAWMAFDSSDKAWVSRAFRGRELWSWIVSARIGTFESGDDGWTLTGEFESGPRIGLQPGRTKIWPPFGTALRNLDSRSMDGTPRGIGRARSPSFRASAGARLSVRLAESIPDGFAGARLLCDEVSVHDFDNVRSEVLLPQVVDVTRWAGRDCVLELYDESDSAWIAAGDIVLLVPGPLEQP